jgi:hypothetical protein
MVMGRPVARLPAVLRGTAEVVENPTGCSNTFVAI